MFTTNLHPRVAAAAEALVNAGIPHMDEIIPAHARGAAFITPDAHHIVILAGCQGNDPTDLAQDIATGLDLGFFADERIHITYGDW